MLNLILYITLTRVRCYEIVNIVIGTRNTQAMPRDPGIFKLYIFKEYIHSFTLYFIFQNLEPKRGWQ